jgi:hypothetical protein
MVKYIGFAFDSVEYDIAAALARGLHRTIAVGSTTAIKMESPQLLLVYRYLTFQYLNPILVQHFHPLLLYVIVS